jgi:hypothetical protein
LRHWTLDRQLSPFVRWRNADQGKKLRSSQPQQSSFLRPRVVLRISFVQTSSYAAVTRGQATAKMQLIVQAITRAAFPDERDLTTNRNRYLV